MTATLAAKRLRPKTYSLAIYLVIAVIFMQIAALVSVFWFRHRVVSVDTNAPELGATLTTTTVPSPIRLLAPLPPAVEEPRNLELPAQVGRLNVQRAQDVTARIAGLNEESTKFRQQGEFKLAAAALQEAEKLDPKNGLTLTSLALLAEAENQREAAVGYWQRIVEVGPTLGTAYMLAKERLIVANQTAKAGGRQALFIDSIQQVNAAENLPAGFATQLKISIGSRGAESALDPSKVSVQLYFYDRRGDGKVVPTATPPRITWVDKKLDWLDPQNETLLADYRLTAGADNRQYFGYVLRIWYRGVLQDERVEPLDLLQLVPSLRS
jgi:tetratricopeptide (TPR) repeat protein